MSSPAQEQSYTRSEWSGLSIQDRIRAMNDSLVRESSLETPSESNGLKPNQDEPSEGNLGQENTDEFSEVEDEKEDRSINSSCEMTRSSVIDIWRQRENQNLARNQVVTPITPPRTVTSPPRTFPERNPSSNEENTASGLGNHDQEYTSKNEPSYPPSPTSKSTNTVVNTRRPSPPPPKKLVVDTSLLPKDAIVSLNIDKSKIIPADTSKHETRQVPKHTFPIKTSSRITDEFKEVSQDNLGLNESKGSIEEEVHQANGSSPTFLKKKQQQERRATIVDIWTQRERTAASPSRDAGQSPACIMSTFFNKELGLDESRRSFDGVQNSFSSGGVEPNNPTTAESSISRPQNLPTGRRSLSVLERWKRGMVHTDDFSSSQEATPPRKGQRGNQYKKEGAMSSFQNREGASETGEKVSIEDSNHSPTVSPRRLHKMFDAVADSPIQNFQTQQTTMLLERSPFPEDFLNKKEDRSRNSVVSCSLVSEKLFNNDTQIETASLPGASNSSSDGHGMKVKSMNSTVAFGRIRDDLALVGNVKSMTATFSTKESHSPRNETRSDIGAQTKSMRTKAIDSPQSSRANRKGSVLDRWINRDGQSPDRVTNHACDKSSTSGSLVGINYDTKLEADNNVGGDTQACTTTRYRDSRLIQNPSTSANKIRSDDDSKNQKQGAAKKINSNQANNTMDEDSSLKLDYSDETVLSSKSDLDLTPTIEESKPSRVSVDSATFRPPSNTSVPSDEEGSSSSSSSSVRSPAFGRLGASPFSALLKEDVPAEPSISAHRKSPQGEIENQQSQATSPRSSSGSLSRTPVNTNSASNALSTTSSLQAPHELETTQWDFDQKFDAEDVTFSDFWPGPILDEDFESSNVHSKSETKKYKKHFARLVMKHDELTAEGGKEHYSGKSTKEYYSEGHPAFSAGPTSGKPSQKAVSNSTSSEPADVTGPRLPDASASYLANRTSKGKDRNSYFGQRSATIDEDSKLEGSQEGALVRPIPATSPTRPGQNSPVQPVNADQAGSEAGNSDIFSFFSHTGSAFSGYSAQSGGLPKSHADSSELRKKSHGVGAKQSHQVERFAQDLARKVLTQPETRTQAHLARHTQNFQEAFPNSATNSNSPKRGIGLSERYNTSSRFLSKEDVLSDDPSLGIGASTASSAINAPNVSSSNLTETSQSFESGASESAYTGISEVYNGPQRQSRRKNREAEERPIQDEFSEAFQNAYQSFDIKKMSDKVSFSAFDLKQLASGLNESVQAASETFRKFVPGPDSGVSRCGPSIHQKEVLSKDCVEEEKKEDEMTIGEEIAIEVEYVSESDDSDIEDSRSVEC